MGHSDDESSHDKHRRRKHKKNSSEDSDDSKSESGESSAHESSEDSESDSESYIRGYRVSKHSKKPHSSHWTYTGKCGPAHWGDLKPEYSAAKDGTCQSPIDLTGAKESDGVDVSYDYKETPMVALNNGHTVQINYAPGSTMTVNGAAYELKQFHFHVPSEHTVDGDHRAMEMHLVHQNAEKQLAVLGVFIQAGEENESLAPIWNNLPPKPSVHNAEGSPPPTVTTPGNICAASLLPGNKKMFRYSGSLTTPPCSEGVYWLVLEEPIQMSKQQIGKFRRLFRHNNRPTQPLNDRELFTGDELQD